MNAYDRDWGDESVIKPIGPLAQIISNTSAGDMLLLMIAMDRQNTEIETEQAK